MAAMRTRTRSRVLGEYEYRVLVVPRTASRADLRQQLADEAEYGKWELARSRVYVGGSRKVWLRRRIIRVDRTM